MNLHQYAETHEVTTSHRPSTVPTFTASTGARLAHESTRWGAGLS